MKIQLLRYRLIFCHLSKADSQPGSKCDHLVEVMCKRAWNSPMNNREKRDLHLFSFRTLLYLFLILTCWYFQRTSNVRKQPTINTHLWILRVNIRRLALCEGCLWGDKLWCWSPRRRESEGGREIKWQLPSNWAADRCPSCKTCWEAQTKNKIVWICDQRVKSTIDCVGRCHQWKCKKVNCDSS